MAFITEGGSPLEWSASNAMLGACSYRAFRSAPYTLRALSWPLMPRASHLPCRAVALSSFSTSAPSRPVADHNDLDEVIRASMASAHIPSMAALVQRNGTLLFSRAYGYANPFSNPVLNASVSETPYTMASVSKTVMASTLMLLFDKGLFSLDEDVNAYLRRYVKAGFEVRNPHFPEQART